MSVEGQLGCRHGNCRQDKYEPAEKRLPDGHTRAHLPVPGQRLPGLRERRFHVSFNLGLASKEYTAESVTVFDPPRVLRWRARWK